MQGKLAALACSLLLACLAAPEPSSAAPTLPFAFVAIGIQHRPTSHPVPGYVLAHAPPGWDCSVNGDPPFTVPAVPLDMPIGGPNPSVSCTPPAGGSAACLNVHAQGVVALADPSLVLTAVSSCPTTLSAEIEVQGPWDQEYAMDPPPTGNPPPGGIGAAVFPFTCAVADNSAPEDDWWVNCLALVL